MCLWTFSLGAIYLPAYGFAGSAAGTLFASDKQLAFPGISSTPSLPTSALRGALPISSMATMRIASRPWALQTLRKSRRSAQR